jgi:hypothetical protein
LPASSPCLGNSSTTRPGFSRNGGLYPQSWAHPFINGIEKTKVVFSPSADRGGFATEQNRRDIKNHPIHQTAIERFAMGLAPTLDQNMLHTALSKISQNGSKRLTLENQGSIPEFIGENFRTGWNFSGARPHHAPGLAGF